MGTAFAPLVDNEIQQSPLDQSLPVQQQDTPVPVMDQSAPFQPLPMGSQGLEMLSRNPGEDTSDRMRKYEQSSGGFMPHFLATMAALTGNFGPAIQLHEQKRKTALGKAVFPDIVKINALTNQGKFKEAQELAETVGASAGTRSPELVPMFQQISQRIADKENRVVQTTARADYYESANNLWKGRHNGEDNPFIKNALTFFKQHAKNMTPIDNDLAQQIMRDAEQHIQVMNNQVIGVGKSTGEMDIQPVPQAFQASQADSIGGLQVGASFGLSGNQLADLMNNLPVTSSQGNVIQPGSPEATQVKQFVTNSQQLDAFYKRSPLIPIDPTQTLHLLNTGVTPEEIATRHINKSKIEPGLQDFWKRKYMEALIPVQAQNEENALAISQSGGLVIDATSLQPVNRPVTVKEIRESGGKLITVGKEQHQKVILPTLVAIQGLDTIPRLLAEIGDINQPKTRLGEGINSKLSSLLGVPLSDTVVARTAVKSIIDNAIEQVNALISPGRPNAAIGQLKQYMSGHFANTDDLVKAATFVQGELKRILNNNVGNAPQTALPSGTKGGTFTPESPLTIYDPGEKSKSNKAAAQALKRAIQGGATIDNAVPAAPVQPGNATPAVPTPPVRKPGLKPGSGF